MSLLDALNLPDGFGYLLLVLGLILTLAPLFHGQDFGILKIPDFTPRMRRSLMLAGPLALALAIGAHVPLGAGNTGDLAERPAPIEDTGEPQSPPPDGETPERVLAEWQGSGCLFPARILDRDGQTATLLFDFGGQNRVKTSEVFTAAAPSVEIGATGFAKLPNRDAWLPISIRDTRTQNVKVSADPEAVCAAEFGKMVKWIPIADLIDVTPLGERS